MDAPRTPDDLLDVANAFFASRALQIAVRAGALAALAAGPRRVADVAAACATEPRATELLLLALAGLGLVERSGPESFGLTPLGGECFAGGERDLSDYVRLSAATYEAWGRFEEALRSGRPIQVSTRAAEEGAARRHRDFILAMRSTARGNAPLVAARLDLAAALGRRPARFLDLGGGPGTYSIELCRAIPGLRATVFDLPETIAIAREVVAADAPDCAARIDFRAGDYFRDPLGGPYDVAWVSHVVHGHPEGSLPALFSRVAASLAPGGLVAIHDFILDDSRARPGFAALFALNMLVMSEGGRTYALGELRALLEGAGFRDVERRDLGEPRGIAVVLGRRR